jgi:hypothetical protein
MNPSRLASFLPFLLLGAPLCAQGDVDMRTIAKKGDSVWLAQEEKQHQSTDMGGQEMEQEQATRRVLHVTVKDVDDKGNLIVETKIVRVHGKVTMMGMDGIEFDSAKPDGADAAAGEEDGMGGMGAMLKKQLGAGAGKSFTAKVSTLGKVVELTDGAAELTSGGGGPMGGGMNEGTLKQLVESAFGLLSEKPIAVGGKWPHAIREKSRQAPVDLKLELTLAKADADMFEITGAGTVEKSAEDAKKEDELKLEGVDDEQKEMLREMLKGMAVKNGKVAGAQKISRKDGFVLEATNTVTMDIEMTMGPMEIVTAVKVTTTTTRTTADAALPPAKEAPKKEEAKDEAAKPSGK